MIATASNANEWAAIDVDDLDRDHKARFGGWPAYGAGEARERAVRGRARAAVHRGGRVRTTPVSSRRRGVRTPCRCASTRRSADAPSRERPKRGPRHWCTSRPSPNRPRPSGTFFNGLRPNGRTHRLARDPVTAARLWERTLELVGD